MSTNAKIKTYRNYSDIPRASYYRNFYKRRAPYRFLRIFYGL